jgi:hypothetical protein
VGVPDSQSGMNAVPQDRGLALIAAHCAALDAGASTARERLDDAVGEEFARKLLFALTGGGQTRQRGNGFLDARGVFAA